MYYKNIIEPYKIKFLLPGELFFSKKPYKITTVLGSCISVTLYNKKYHCGGMNHYMLAKSGYNKSNECLENKYGEFAIKNLIDEIKKIDNNKNNWEAKIFGGGNVVPSISNSKIGEANAKIAVDILQENKIPIIKKYINNNFGLKIHFFNFNNKVFVSKIKKTQF
jgi:chemotaxis protein CheD